MSGAPDILAVALVGAGYGSHEAFTRAFRQHFGVTPEQFRGDGGGEFGKFIIKLQEPFLMDSSSHAALESPRVVGGAARLTFGMGQPCPAAGDPGLPGLWNRVAPHI